MGSSAEGAFIGQPASGTEPGPAGDEGTLSLPPLPSTDDDAPPGPELDAPENTTPIATPVDDAPFDDEDESQPVEQAVEPVVEHMRGGSVTVTGRQGRLAVVAARPRPGFVMTTDFHEVSNLTIVFSDGAIRSTLDAEWIDGGLRVTTSETAEETA